MPQQVGDVKGVQLTSPPVRGGRVIEDKSPRRLPWNRVCRAGRRRDQGQAAQQDEAQPSRSSHYHPCNAAADYALVDVPPPPATAPGPAVGLSVHSIAHITRRGKDGNLVVRRLYWASVATSGGTTDDGGWTPLGIGGASRSPKQGARPPDAGQPAVRSMTTLAPPRAHMIVWR